MKRIVIAVPLLLLFIVGASLTCIFLLRDTERKAGAFIGAVEETALREDYSACLDALDGFARFWEERKSLYLLFVRHEEMHDIEIGIEQMTGFARCRDKSGIIGELFMLKAMLEHNSESELPLLINIL